MYRNKSKIFEVCKEMLNLMNSDLYIGLIIYYAYDIFGSENALDASIENKAQYMKSDQVIINNNDDELKRLINPGIENEVRLQGMFRNEIVNTICEYKDNGVDLLSRWFSNRPADTDDIAERAIKNFDTIKNSETYPFDTLAAQLMVTYCVRGYFERVMIGE